MKHIIKWSMLSLVISLSTESCSLEPEMAKEYFADVAWTNESNLELALNKFYPLIGQSYYTPNIQQDAYADVLRMNNPSADQNRFGLGTSVITSGANPLDNWQWGSTWVTDCNRFLAGMEQHGKNLSSALKQRAEAEVRFFRAYVYFEMAKRYGASVVLFDKLPTEEYNKRATPDEVWDFIAKDLDYAASFLPTTVTAAQQGKLTKGAALGLKARAMLYAKRWKASSDAVLALEALKLYDLNPSYEDTFNQKRAANKPNPESILEYGYSSPNFGYSFDYFFCPPGDKGFAQISPTENLVSAYQMADGTAFDWTKKEHAAKPYEGREARFYASILYNGASWKGRTIESYVGGIDGFGLGANTTNTGYYMRKLFDGSNKTQSDGFRPGELTYYFMRYAEVLLIYAEAMAQQDEIPEALKALNRVRKRAGFTQDLTARYKDEFMKLLVHERMIELAFEGHRYWDLRRWGLATQVLNGTEIFGTKITKQTDGSFKYEKLNVDNDKKRFYPEKYNRFPIPIAEIQRNPLMEQFDEWK